ncbi:MAG: sensor histidine kinase [Acidimicrobiia bacterium]|nr:sensor histidine kinase [Acidimicrobiia bacterium]
MASTSELARLHTTLPRPAVDHLQRLVASWGLLADLCFADLLLYAPVTRSDVLGDAVTGRSLVVLGQVRPLTSQTLYRADLVGSVFPASERSEVFRSWEQGEIMDAERTHPELRENVRTLCVPVRWQGDVIAVLTRESAPWVGRQPGDLERAYVELFNRLVRMIAAGQFPFVLDDRVFDEAPRVGDGVVVLDNTRRVEYSSPNAVSALHRVGVHANTEGMRLAELGIDEAPVRYAFTKRGPATEELEHGPDVTILLHCLPLIEGTEVTGALVLLRDISELRRRDRMLMTKDATIREIHHRVKNNLQTISSLLRIQGRRLSTDEAKDAIEESVRRIQAIAVVHDTLAHGIGDDVRFDEVLRPLVRMVEESLVDPERPVRFVVRGDAGRLPATVATSLAVVLSELLQNVMDHAYPGGPPEGGGTVTVEVANDGTTLTVRVIDDGVGPPNHIDVLTTGSLGLSIVRTLVNAELGGTITMVAAGGAPERPGTVVEVRIPLEEHEEPVTGVVPKVVI